jgi:hypothetical protein
MTHDYQMNFYKLIRMQPKGLTLKKKLVRIDRLSCREALQKAHTELNPTLTWFYALGSVLLFYYHKLWGADIKDNGEIQELYAQLIELCCYEQRVDIRGAVQTPRETLDKIQEYTTLRYRLTKLLEEVGGSLSDISDRPR